MSNLNPLNIQKPQDIHFSDESRHSQFKTAGLAGNYSSMSGLIYNGNNVRSEVEGKVNIKELYNEIDEQIHQLEDYNQSGVNDVLEEHTEDFQDTVDNISDKGAYDPTAVYHFGNIVDYSRMNSNITPKYASQQTITQGYNLLNWSSNQGSVVATVNNDQTITLNGTTAGFSLNFEEVTLEANKTYKAKAILVSGTCTSSASGGLGIMSPLGSGNWLRNDTFDTFTPTEDTARHTIWVGANGTYDNAVFKIYFYEGSDDKPYEPYTNNVSSPSPEYRQPITTIKAVNLFDKDYFLTHISDFTAFYQNYFFGIELGDEFKTVIDASTFLKGTTQSNYVLALLDEVRKPENVDRFLNTNGEISNKIYDFTNSEHVYFVFGRSTQMSTESVRLEVLQTILNNYNVQVEEGDTPHIYAPYGKIPLKCSTNNLAVNSEYTLDSDQTESTRWAAITNDFIEAKYGQTYTLSFYYNNILNYSNTNGYAYVYAYDSNKQKIGSDYMSTQNPALITKTIDNQNIEYLKIMVGVKGLKGDNFKVQLEEGSTRTDYKPYYDKYFYLDMQGNELCKIKTGTDPSSRMIEDEIVIDNNNNIVLNKKINKLVLDGTENWTSSSLVEGTYGFTTTDTSVAFNTSDEIKVISDYFEGRTTTSTIEDGDIGISTRRRNNQGLFIRMPSDVTTVSGFKTWLSTHNTTAYYELQTPQEISLGTLPADFLPHLGNVNVELCTNLENVNKYSMTTNSYLTLQDTTAGTLPTNTTYFKNIGLTGDKGDSSMGTVTCGIWDSSATYNEKDLVAYGTDLYVAKSTNTNQTPSSSSAYWELIIQYDKPLVALGNYAPENIINGSLWLDIL